MSSAEPGPDEEKEGPDGPPADSITDPALAAEVDNPADANAPSGAGSAPDGGAAAADEGPIPAPGSPGELSSDQAAPQGEERGETVPAEPLGDVAGGDAGSPESGSPDTATAKPQAPSAAPAEDAPESAAAPDQPPATPSAAVAEGAAVQRATEEKVEQAVAARQSSVSAAAEVEPEPGDVDEGRQRLLDTLGELLGEGVIEVHLEPGVDAWARVAVDEWREACRSCRDQLGLSYFCYLSAIDWMPSPYGRSEDPPPGEEPEEPEGAAGGEAAEVGSPAELEHGVAGGETRMQLLARLVSPTTHLGLTLKADLDDDAPVAPSLVGIFPGADWHEREAWEMYGIDFTGHPNLIHLYLPGGFEGHPLRKDFPLLAREVKPWPGLVDVEAMPGEGDGD